MEILLQIMGALRLALGFLVGGCIGYSFGYVQNRAARRYARMQSDGKLKHFIGVVPGSIRRIALLMIVLLLVQLICPIFFADGTQWWVSGGIAAGYGYLLYLQLQERRKAG